MMLALNTLSTNVVIAKAARPSGPGSAIAAAPLSSGLSGLAGAISGRIDVAMAGTPLRGLCNCPQSAPATPIGGTDQSPALSGVFGPLPGGRWRHPRGPSGCPPGDLCRY